MVLNRFDQLVADYFHFMVIHGYEANRKTYREAVVYVKTSDEIPF